MSACRRSDQLGGEARLFAVITILKLPNTHDITPPIAAPGTDRGWTKEVQMADELIGKPPSLSAAGSRSKKVRSGTTGRSVTQPEDEILLQICCSRSDSRSPTQLFVAVGGSPGRRLGAYRPGRPASHVFPEAEPEPILAAPPGPSHRRMTTRAPARSDETKPLVRFCAGGAQ